MKQTLNAYQVADLLRKDENASWTYEGAKAIAELIEQEEEELQTETEFCRVQIRCEWSEMTAREIAEQYGLKKEKGKKLEETARDHLQDNTSSFMQIEGDKGETRFVFRQF